MQTSNRIQAFSDLGHKIGSMIDQYSANHLEQSFEKLSQTLQKSHQQNPWFTIENQLFALKSWAEALTKENLTFWTKNYDLNPMNPMKIGMVAAGNIPMVGFHDILSVLMSGNKVQVKFSSKDELLIPFVLDLLFEIEPNFKNYFESVEKLENYDAVIATGSDNTARYFESYFKHVPNLIRKNRTSVAILEGDETPEELEGLAKDMMQYFGLGCRNVTKVFIPKDYDLDLIFNALFPWKDIIHHHKYANNYDYFRTIYLMKSIPILENGFVLFKQDEGLFSPISTILYEFYEDKEKVLQQLADNENKIQCIVSKDEKHVDFGKTQEPQLWDYADNVDTLEWLSLLKNHSI